MNSVCSRFVNVLKLRDVFEKILNLKKDRTDPVMMISQGHLELTFQSHLMVGYALVADIFNKRMFLKEYALVADIFKESATGKIVVCGDMH
jgi:hypothetical protein